MPKAVASRSLRVLLGLLFVATAIGKLVDNRGFADVLSHYRIFPPSILLGLALTISLSELYLGIELLRGRFLPTLAGLTIGIHACYLVLALVTLYRGIPIANCGCFGVFLARPLTWSTPVEDGVLVLLSCVFFWLVRGEPTAAPMTNEGIS